jgi:hypothetical protein
MQPHEHHHHHHGQGPENTKPGSEGPPNEGAPAENIEIVEVHPDGHGGTEIDVVELHTDKAGNVEVDLVEFIDIEEFSKSNGGKPPKAKKYRIRVDKEYFTVHVPEMTGRQILELAKKTPVDRWLLNQKLRHGQIKAIGLDEVVDFTAHGVERFMTLPKDQTEGHGSQRRMFALPEEDVEGLNAAGLAWETVTEGRCSWLLVHGLALPPKLGGTPVSVAISIPSGYPTAALDMAFMYPPVRRPDGRQIPATQASQALDGKHWQRWSRHYTATNPWRPGEYNTVTHLQLVRQWFDREEAR